jgi:hypothetical protein
MWRSIIDQRDLVAREEYLCSFDVRVNNIELSSQRTSINHPTLVPCAWHMARSRISPIIAQLVTRDGLAWLLDMNHRG